MHDIRSSLTQKSRKVIWSVVQNAIEKKELQTLTEDVAIAQIMGPPLHRILFNNEHLKPPDVDALVKAFLTAYQVPE